MLWRCVVGFVLEFNSPRSGRSRRRHLSSSNRATISRKRQIRDVRRFSRGFLFPILGHFTFVALRELHHHHLSVKVSRRRRRDISKAINRGEIENVVGGAIYVT